MKPMKEARSTPRNRHILWRFFAQLQQAEDDPEAVDKDLDKAPGNKRIPFVLRASEKFAHK